MPKAPSRFSEAEEERCRRIADPRGAGSRHSVPTGGSAASSTRSTRARSPTRTATASATCPGLIDHLDHLNDGTERSLGVDAIWLSPIYPSPGFDVGYDVSDYDDVDPMLGTLADFDRLVAEAHRRGHPGRARPRHEPHQLRPSLVRGVARATRTARTATGTCGATAGAPAGGRLQAEQLGIVLRRLGLDLGRARAAVLHAHVPARAARPQLAQPGGADGDARDGPGAGSTAASTASGSTSSTRSSSTPTFCRTRATTAAGVPTTARSTSTTRTGPSSRTSWPSSARSSTRIPSG